jgi:hypothetical protein
MKKRVDLNNTILKKEIDRYMDAFDVKKRLILLP